MTVTLQPNALLTLPEAKAYLSAGDEFDEPVKDMINRLSDYCEGPSGAARDLAARDYAHLRFRSQQSRALRPRAWPIDTDSPMAITFDGITQTIWRTESAGNQEDFDVVVEGDEPGVPSHFYRAGGWYLCSVAKPSPISVSYSSLTPAPIKDAAYLILSQMFREQTKGIQSDVQSYGAGPVSPGVTFRESLIPMKAREILSAYRVVAV